MKQWVRPLRTGLQCLLALLPVLPSLLPALGLSATVGVGAVMISMATVLTRVMALPAMEAFLTRLNLNSPPE